MYVRNYVIMVCQGGDDSKQVFWQKNMTNVDVIKKLMVENPAIGSIGYLPWVTMPPPNRDPAKICQITQIGVGRLLSSKMYGSSHETNLLGTVFIDELPVRHHRWPALGVHLAG